MTLVFTPTSKAGWDQLLHEELQRIHEHQASLLSVPQVERVIKVMEEHLNDPSTFRHRLLAHDYSIKWFDPVFNILFTFIESLKQNTEKWNGVDLEAVLNQMQQMYHDTLSGQSAISDPPSDSMILLYLLMVVEEIKSKNA